MKIILGLLMMMGVTVTAVGMTMLFFIVVEELDDFIEKQKRRAKRRKGKG